MLLHASKKFMIIDPRAKGASKFNTLVIQYGIYSAIGTIGFDKLLPFDTEMGWDGIFGYLTSHEVKFDTEILLVS